MSDLKSQNEILHPDRGVLHIRMLPLTFLAKPWTMDWCGLGPTLYSYGSLCNINDYLVARPERFCVSSNPEDRYKSCWSKSHLTLNRRLICWTCCMWGVSVGSLVCFLSSAVPGQKGFLFHTNTTSCELEHSGIFFNAPTFWRIKLVQWGVHNKVSTNIPSKALNNELMRPWTNPILLWQPSVISNFIL